MKFRFLATAIVCLSFSLPGLALAVPIGLFNTGVDDSGVSLPGAAADTHFTVLETGNDARVLSNIPGSYLPNSPTSNWIWENANGMPINVTRTFRTTFDLTGLDAATAVINGLWGTDNFGVDILINGISTGNSLPNYTTDNFNTLHAFSITDGFVAGVNTLDFIIRDVGVVAGFRAELSGSAEALVPEPGAVALLALGLIIVGIQSRKKQSF